MVVRVLVLSSRELRALDPTRGQGVTCLADGYSRCVLDRGALFSQDVGQLGNAIKGASGGAKFSGLDVKR